MKSILKTTNIVKKYGIRTVLNKINMNINKRNKITRINPSYFML